MSHVFTATVSNLASCQNVGVRIVANTEAVSCVDACPLVFALAYSGRIKISIGIGAEADAVGAHLCVSRIFAAANTSTGHLSIV